jgi:hypothetical protein
MCKAKSAAVTLMCVFVLCAGGLAQDNCALPQLMNQREDAATIQRLEGAWTEAFLHGDTEFMRCLLVPEFSEIMRSGELRSLADELAMTAKNRGKNLPVPELPKITVLIHNNVAVAYGESIAKDANGKPRSRWYSDSYVWEDGKWHVFFAQQTSAEVP